MTNHIPILEMKHLWKEYGDNIVLERLSLTVQAGEFISIVGASGCGKTTFLNLLLGTEKPSRGELLLDGEPLNTEPDETRGIVFQKYSVFPHLTVLDNVMLGQDFAAQGIGRLFGRRFGQERKRVMTEAKSMLAQVGLARAEEKYPHELSGGMRQRLSIAQALMKKPRILLLDEPFGALDPGIRKEMHRLIQSLWQSQKLTIFMITHDLSEGFHLGSRLWVFDHTRIDPHAPERFGAQVTFDIPIDQSSRGNIPSEIQQSIA